MALTPTDLTYAILSMDSYQRGAGRDPSDVTAPFTDLEVPLPVGFADAGFSATAYLVNGKAVISYRGTDTPVFSWDFLDDVWNGYGVGLGSPEGKQAELAIKFYQSVRDQGYTDIVLTGHSLGGGLAGMVASIYGEEAVIFDNMAFKDAASKAFEYATTGEPVLVAIDPYGNEQYEYVVNETLRDLIYKYGPPAPINQSQIKAVDVEGEILATNRQGQNNVPLDRLALSSDVDLSGIDRHKMNMLTLLAHAELSGQTEWRAVEKYVAEALYLNTVADDAGVQASENDSSSGVMRTQLAYSALDAGTRPFGNAGATAWLDDANDLGKAKQIGFSNFDESRMLAQTDLLEKAMAASLTQFAGWLANQKVANSGQAGVLTVSEANNTLGLDFSDQTWDLTGSVPQEFLGRLAILDEIGIAAETSIGGHLSDVFGSATGENIDQFVVGLGTGGTWTMEPNANGNVSGFIGTGGADTIIGTSGNDLIFAGEPVAPTGQEPPSGPPVQNIVSGGDGDDLIISAGGADILLGGSGSDILIGGESDDLLSGSIASPEDLEYEDTRSLFDDRRVYDDGARDILEGGFGNDDYWITLDATIDATIENASSPIEELSPLLNFSDVVVYHATRDEQIKQYFVQSIALDAFSNLDVLRDSEGNNTVGVDTSSYIGSKILDGGVPFSGNTFEAAHGGLGIFLFELHGQGTGGFASNADGFVYLNGGDLYGFSRIGFQEIYHEMLPGEEGAASGFHARFVIENFTNGDFGISLPISAQGSDGDDNEDFSGSSNSGEGISYNAYGGDDVIIATNDSDTVSGGDGNDDVRAGDGDDTVNGDAGNDVIDGEAGNDSIDGGAGNDTLRGGAGNDVLTGDNQVGAVVVQSGNDVLIGGDGNDKYMYSLGAGNDTIRDNGLSTDSDTLVLYKIITSDVVMHKTGSTNQDLLITVVPTGQTITVHDQFLENNEGIESIQFVPADTGASLEVWDAQMIEANAIPVEPQNNPPAVASHISDQSSPEDAAWSFTVPSGTFADADGDTLSYSATISDGSNLPSWLTFNAATQTFAGTPPQDFNGTLSLKVTASDGQASADSSFNLVINSVNDAPIVVTDLTEQSSPEDTAWSFTVSSGSFTDADGDALSYTATLGDGSALPSWLTFNAATQTFSGTPPQDFNGTLTLKVTASDGQASADSSFNLVIDPVNDAPVVATAIADQTGSEGTAWSFTVPGTSFADVDGDTLAFSATLADGSALPAWLAFDAASRTFSGTPPQGSSGQITVTVSATDGLLAAEDSFVLTVETGASVIIGTNGNETLNGTAGDDQIFGLDGDDILIGGLGGDALDGGEGWDGAAYWSASSAVTVNLTDTSQNTGVALGDSYTNIEAVFGTTFNDTLTGDAEGTWLFGGNGDDVLNGMGGDDYLIGETGKDTFIFSGDFGWDTIEDFEAGVGAGDVIRFDGGLASFADVMAVASQNGSNTVISLDNTKQITLLNVSLASLVEDDFAFASIPGSIVTGTNGNETLTGTGGDDQLFGLDGDDTLIGGLGADALDGGDGWDGAAYWSAPSAVTVNLTDTSQNTGAARGDTYTNIEAVFGSTRNDTLIGDAGTTWLFGGNGDDVLNGMGGDDYLLGETGNDTFVFSGDFGWDTIEDFEAGAAAGDVIRFEGGLASFADVMAVSSQNGSNTVISLDNNKQITLLNVSLASLVEDDFAFVSIPGSVVTGTNGNETLTGTGGDDQLFGLDGDDILIGGLGADALDGGDGWDGAAYWSAAKAVTVNLTDSSQNTGEARGDTYTNIEAIFGSTHNDTLIGDGGMSWLFGGDGDDVLRGMGGDNYLYGETGNDTFVFAADFGWDTIDDFEAGAGAGDVIRFEGIFSSFAAVQAAASQSGSNTVIDIGANMRLTLNNVAVTGLHQDDFQFA